MNKLPVLLFDIGNVFIFADHKITHRHFIEKYNVLPAKAKKFFTIKEYRTFAEGKISGKQYTKKLIKVLGKPELTDEQIRQAHDIHLVRPIKNSMDVLNEIYQRKKYQIAFITNTNAWQNKKEKQLVDFSMFSDLIIRSNQEGFTKRSPVIFKRAIKRIGSNNILFIDDSETNIKTARSLGINSVHVTKNKPNLASALVSNGVAIK